MKIFGTIFEKIYSEEDSGNNISISLSGTLGLCLYLYSRDIMISIFSFIIAFPLIRIIVQKIINYQKKILNKKKRIKQDKDLLENLSEQEKDVLRKFVKHGTCSLSYSYINNYQLNLPKTVVNSLIMREMIQDTMIGMDCNEALVLNADIFELAKKYL